GDPHGLLRGPAAREPRGAGRSLGFAHGAAAARAPPALRAPGADDPPPRGRALPRALPLAVLVAEDQVVGTFRVDDAARELVGETRATERRQVLVALVGARFGPERAEPAAAGQATRGDEVAVLDLLADPVQSLGDELGVDPFLAVPLADRACRHAAPMQRAGEELGVEGVVDQPLARHAVEHGLDPLRE